ncbi:MAG: 23S rRNA (adenine(2503)-C(2))-methyltransferase RlmN [bacterium]|nr:23S rRNA (adenine(2503)-C(2))-methyltransferase RlmN [bacterium]
MNLEKLENFLKDNKQPKFRLEQIRKAVYQDGVSSFLEITTIPKDLRELLDEKINILSFEVEKVLVSDDKRSAKALLKVSCHPDPVSAGEKSRINLTDGKIQGSFVAATQDDSYYIETVLLSPRPNTWTVCISSQVGCPMGCAFCATGKGGFKRNLTAGEITDQVLFWKQYLKKKSTSPHPLLEKERGIVNNIVFMGMGEPFLNWEEVKKSLEDLINPKLFEFGSRSISVSTVGVPGGIEKLLNEFSQINLAISLHFAEDEIRGRYMPANKAYNLDTIKGDLKKYFARSKRKIFIEYIMFGGLNDSLADAKKLTGYLKSIGNSYLSHVNLIAYNSHNMERGTHNAFDFRPSSKAKIIDFRNYLLQNKINATIRKSLGQEISGACGQLAG